jgi:hypothetical protein
MEEAKKRNPDILIYGLAWVQKRANKEKERKSI